MAERRRAVVAAAALAIFPPGELSWQGLERGAIRGLTVGPVESELHPGRGYGGPSCREAMEDAERMGATWVSITPFGRVWDLRPTGVDLRFETPFRWNRKAVLLAIEQAHAEGLRVMLVPHLWVESGEWRALIDPGDDEAWARWTSGYRAFVLEWAKVAAESNVELFSVGVELRSWVTTERAPSFADIIHDVRQIYPGPLTYAANWDDVADTVVLGDLDVIGINGFYPLAEKPGATLEEMMASAGRIRDDLARLAGEWGKPILFTEIGYTTRPDPAVRPWEWPEHLGEVTVDERAQALAYYALLAPFVLDAPWLAGFFAWRVYADPFDALQEMEWGFSPKGKLAELVLRDAFAARWGADGNERGDSLARFRAREIGDY